MLAANTATTALQTEATGLTKSGGFGVQRVSTDNAPSANTSSSGSATKGCNTMEGLKVVNGFLAGAAIATSLILAGKAVANTGGIGTAAQTSPRYTPREIVKLRHHSCNEDEMLFVPAVRVNDNVHIYTRDHAYCVHVDNVRRAPQN